MSNTKIYIYIYSSIFGAQQYLEWLVLRWKPGESYKSKEINQLLIIIIIEFHI